MKIYNKGKGAFGQLGHLHGYHEFIPKKVEALADKVIVDVTCGGYNTIAVSSTGSRYTWGCDGCDDNIFLPTLLLPDLRSKGVISLSAGFYFTACVTKAGEVFTWGYGNDGRLGHGDGSDLQSPKRVEALVGVKAKQVSCGDDHTAVCTGGTVVYTHLVEKSMEN